MRFIHPAAEFGRFGITVNAYCPGGIYTPLCEHYHLNVSPVPVTNTLGLAIS
jgi:NAD(P)-dependent dehydrogenase (short-subunit alcohol dehydrogenase family)